MSGSDESGKFRCCCSCCHIKNSTYGIAIISLVLIIVNFVLKAFGYSQIDWNWELLFFIVDGLAVLSLFYGIYSEKASFLQPFAVLSIFTVSFLALLAAFCGTAIYDPKSYAAEWFEMELRKRMDAGKHLRFNLTFSDLVWISSSVGICCLVLLTALHAWFLVLVVKCAQFFRFLETQTKSDIESQE